jgi:tetratricopeptide (TPR) repeat protein
MDRNPNRKFAAMLARSGCSHKGFARRVQDVADARGVRMSCDHTTVQRWLDGVEPRGVKPQIIAEALSVKLGVPVTVSDIGMDYADGAISAAAAYPERFGDGVAVLGQLVRHDLAQPPSVAERPVDPDAWRELVARWFTDPDDEPGPLLSHGLTAGDVDLVSVATEMFSGLDYRFGGGRPRLLVAHVLDTEILPTLGRITPGLPLASEYLSEVGALLRLGAWTAYDVGCHWLAQSYFTQALRIARAAGNRILGGRIFAGMSHQANYLGHFQRAVELARAAHEGFRGQGTPTAMAVAWAMEARAQASLHRERECAYAISEAERWFALRDPASEPSWLRYFDDAELHAEIAHCYRDLGYPAKACRHAELSIASSEDLYVRSLSFCRVVLATGHLLDGDLDQATAIAAGVVDTAADQLRSSRVLAYLGDFRERLTPYQDARPAREFEGYLAERLRRDGRPPAASGPIALGQTTQNARQRRGALSSRRSAIRFRSSAPCSGDCPAFRSSQVVMLSSRMPCNTGKPGHSVTSKPP